MELIEITERPEFASKEKVNKKITGFTNLINELRKRPLSEKEVETINNEIKNINASSGPEKDFMKTLAKSQANILKVIEKESKLVVKNHYRNLWLVLGMSAFGIPIGVAFGISIGNLGLLGLGFPIGMGMGVAVGTSLDNKAAKEGRQLDVVFTA
ncbi:hypothetical protein [Cognataquiflexum rubidum]|uniref:hypothetical protein n=1 Tax=Cognataquiflexum rubidum TaxID=2922273 RepID=UPI001F149640|nr:hypothetical protein [Cognataquiflexum rubidum]MCH6234386.1 hypothetical protein [Cognataquiflexum rubidum]